MSVTQKYFEGVRPVQTYLAEDLDPEWLQQNQEQLQRQLASDDDPNPTRTAFHVACNSLELGVKLGVHEYIDKGMAGLKGLADNHPQGITHGLVLRSRALMISQTAFHVRADRKKLFPDVMADVHVQGMNLLEEIRNTRYDSAGDQQRDVIALISFGAISRLQYKNNFPYFSTLREAREAPAAANHDWYSLTYHGGMHKLPASLRKGEDNIFAIHAPQQIADALMSRRVWYKEHGLPFEGPDVRQARLDAAADLLIRESRGDDTLLDFDFRVLHAISKHFSNALHRFKPDWTRKNASSPAESPKSATAPDALVNTDMAEQLRRKFGLSE